MSLNSHLTELRRKHENLATRIEQEQRHPAHNEVELTSLKKQKLRLKEEITRLSAAAH